MFFILRYQNASAVMVWGTISKIGRLSLVLIDGKYYKTEVLEKLLLPTAWTFYGEEYFCFQQDEAPSHTVQKWFNENLPDFISKYECSPSSPDLNTLDFCIWSYKLAQLKYYKYQTLPDLKKIILTILAAIPDDVMRAACNSFEE
jgi:hypothetical protein